MNHLFWWILLKSTKKRNFWFVWIITSYNWALSKQVECETIFTKCWPCFKFWQNGDKFSFACQSIPLDVEMIHWIRIEPGHAYIIKGRRHRDWFGKTMLDFKASVQQRFHDVYFFIEIKDFFFKAKQYHNVVYCNKLNPIMSNNIFQ